MSPRRDTSSHVQAGFLSEPLDSPRCRAWHATCTQEYVTASETISLVDWAARAETPPAAIYSFVPAGVSEAARSEARQAVRSLLKAIGAHLADVRDDGADVLANFPGSLCDTKSPIICKDLSAADLAQAAETIRASDAVFVVSTTDPASVNDAHAHATLLRHMMRALHREPACGLLLVPTPGGIPEIEAEQRIGLPMCGVLRSTDHIAQLARSIVLD